MRALRSAWLGEVAYSDGLALQRALVERRRAGDISDTLLLLEHPHVITRGTGSHDEHILLDEAARVRMGIELHDAGRGGDVTYHGPGQLVGYPIIDLKPDRKDLHRWLRDLEQTLIEALATFGIPAGRVEGLTGVWSGRGKIAAIGVRVSSGWITSHGFALNVDPQLSYFDTIVPCGIADRAVTSMREELGCAPDEERVRGEVRQALARSLGASLDDSVEPSTIFAEAGVWPGQHEPSGA